MTLTTRMLELPLVTLALAVSLAFSTPARADPDRHVVINNETSHTMVRFYASNASTDSWEEDILGDSIVRPGHSVRINVDDGTGACIFDFKAVFDDGDVLIRRGVNVCKVGEYDYTE